MLVHPTYDLVVLGAGNFATHLVNSLLDSGYQGSIALVDERDHFSQPHRWCSWWPKDRPSPLGTTQQWGKYFTRSGGKLTGKSLSNWSYLHVDAPTFYEKSHRAWSRAAAKVDLFTGTAVQSPPQEFSDFWEIGLGNRSLRGVKVIDTRSQTQRMPKESFCDRTGWWQSFCGKIVQGRLEKVPPESFGLMDFDLSDPSRFSFGYILPLPGKQTLFEYTAFNRAAVPLEEMRAKLDGYLDQWDIGRSIRGTEEHGWIPMSQDIGKTPARPEIWEGGLRGGCARPATGYAFYRNLRMAQSMSRAILRKDTSPPKLPQGVFPILDGIFLETLVDNPALTREVMETLLHSLNGDELADFLNESAPLRTVAKVISLLPKTPFLGGVWRKMFSRESTLAVPATVKRLTASSRGH